MTASTRRLLDSQSTTTVPIYANRSLNIPMNSCTQLVAFPSQHQHLSGSEQRRGRPALLRRSKSLCVRVSPQPTLLPLIVFQYASSNTRVVNQVRIRRDHFQRFVTDLRGGRYAVDLDRLLMVRENTLESLAFVSDVVITAMRML